MLENILRKIPKPVKHVITGLAISSILAGASCSEKPNTPITPDPYEDVKLGESVEVLDSLTMGNLSSYQNGVLTFLGSSTQLNNLSQGDIVIGGKTTASPSGFLGSVSSISQDRKTITVSQATLEDAFQSANVNFSKRLNPSDILQQKSLPGVPSPASTQAFDFNIAMNDVLLHDFDGNPNTKYDQIVANGEVSFDYDINFGLKMSSFKVDSLSFASSISKDFNLSLALGPSLSVGKEVTIAEYVFGGFPVPGTPIVVVPVLEVHAGVEGSTEAVLKTGINQNSSLNSSLVYTKTAGWKASANFSNQFEFEAPALSASASVKGYVGTNLDFLIFGVGGPGAEANGYLELSAEPSENLSWNFYGGLEGLIGAKVKIILGSSLLDFSKKIVDEKKLLAEGEIPLLSASLVSVPNSGTAPLEVLLDASSSRGNIKEYHFTFGDGSQNYVETASNHSDGAFDGKTRHVYNKIGMLKPSVAIVNGQQYDSRSVDVEVKEKPQKIVFSRVLCNTGNCYNSDIFIINADGTGEINLTNTPGVWEDSPSWSPDATKIVYSSSPTSDLYGYDYNIFVMSPDGSGKRQLTSMPEYELRPVFSGNGSLISFIVYSQGKNKAYVMNSDGSNQREFLPNLGYEFSDLSWSPSNDFIAFSSESPENSSSDIYVTNQYGLFVERLTSSSKHNGGPSWSPDNQKIAFSSNRFTRYGQIYVMNRNGSNQTDISQNPSAANFSPSFSPDGKRIVYSSGPVINDEYNPNWNELWIMDANGLNKKKITGNSYDDNGPRWSPK